MDDYKEFEDWFYEIEGFCFRSERFFGDVQCPDPFEKNKILIKWLKTAWELGHESAKKAKE